MQQNAYYKVAVMDGWLVDNEGRYLRNCIRFDCGHNHRSEATAEACHQKLLGWDREHKNCSAKWYNASVVRVDSNGNHMPEPLTPVDDIAEYLGVAK